MYIIEEHVVAKASPAAVWQIWSDVEKWPTWDVDLKTSKLLRGAFRDQATVVMKPKSGPQIQATITDYVLNEKFTSSSSLPLTSISFKHMIEPLNEGRVKVIHRVEFEGWLSGLFYCLLGSGIRKGLPISLKNLVKQLG